MQPELPPGRAGYPAKPPLILFGSPGSHSTFESGMNRGLIKGRMWFSILLLILGMVGADFFLVDSASWMEGMFPLLLVSICNLAAAITFYEKFPKEPKPLPLFPFLGGFLVLAMIRPDIDQVHVLVKSFMLFSIFFALWLTIRWCAGDFQVHSRVPVDRDVPVDMN